MKLPQSVIDDVLARLDIIDVVTKRIALKKTGKSNYSGLCPFHQEKTPSFSVSQVKQFYYCFGCKASGNAIGFVMAYENLSFVDAVEQLATKVGLTLPQYVQRAEEKPQDFPLFEKVAKFFELQLKKHPPAQAYLSERGLSNDIISTFQIGFAPAGWDTLVNTLGNTPEVKKQLLAIGVLAEGEKQPYYDRFRNRIMFPIKNKRGQIIAFGGRNLGNQMPKYLNSPETTYFHKSRELYGLYEVLQANKKVQNLIVVEGYLDVIALHQFGIQDAVATLGTAISLQHLQILLKYADSLCFCFDGDEAGKTAAWRALEIALPLMNMGVKLSFLLLAADEDPDNYIRKHGSTAFLTRITNSLPLSDFFFQKLQAETDLESPAGKTRLVHTANKYLQTIPKGIYQELMYQQLADIVGMNLAKIKEILQPSSAKPNVLHKNVATESNSLPSPMRLAISLLLQNPQLVIELVIPENLSLIKLKGISFLIKILSIIKQKPQLKTASLLEYLEDDEKQFAHGLAAQEILIPDTAWLSELQGAVNKLCTIDIENQIRQLMKKGNEVGLDSEEKQLLQKLLLNSAARA